MEADYVWEVGGSGDKVGDVGVAFGSVRGEMFKGPDVVGENPDFGVQIFTWNRRRVLVMLLLLLGFLFLGERLHGYRYAVLISFSFSSVVVIVVLISRDASVMVIRLSSNESRHDNQPLSLFLCLFRRCSTSLSTTPSSNFLFLVLDQYGSLLSGLFIRICPPPEKDEKTKKSAYERVPSCISH